MNARSVEPIKIRTQSPMPRHSSACQTCLRRKVKCDAHKPKCYRCSQYGTECPGYPERNSNFSFVDQTHAAALKVGHWIKTDQVCDLGVQQARQDVDETSDAGLSTSDPSIRSVITPTNLHREQLLNFIVDLYVPRNIQEETAVHIAYYRELLQIRWESLALRFAISTFECAFVGKMYGDLHLQHQSRIHYSHTLRFLTDALNDSSRNPSEILCAITLLQTTELLGGNSTEDVGHGGWHRHAKGAELYLQYNRARLFKHPLGRALFHSVRHASLCSALTNRIASPFENSSPPNYRPEARSVALANIAHDVPGVLEHFDMIKGRKTSTEDEEQVLARIEDTKMRLIRWGSSHAQSMPVEWQQQLHGGAATRLQMQPLRALSQTPLEFASWNACLDAQLYWACGIFLDSIKLEMLRSRMVSNGEISPFAIDIERVKCRLYHTCMLYCHSIAYCCEGALSSVSRRGPFVMRHIRTFFESNDYQYEACWSTRYVLHYYPLFRIHTVQINDSTND